MIDWLFSSTLLTALTTPVSAELHNYLGPINSGLAVIAGLVASFFIVVAGFLFITSGGQPSRLTQAKTTLKKSLIGLVIVLAAINISNFLTTSYLQPTPDDFQFDFALEHQPVSEPDSEPLSTVSNVVTGLGSQLIGSLGLPLINLLDHLSQITPTIASNDGLWQLWLLNLGLANSLLVLILIFIGLKMMASENLELPAVDLSTLLVRLGAIFLAVNLSLILIDALIGLSNALIASLNTYSPVVGIWQMLEDLTVSFNNISLDLASMILMLLFLVVAGWLVVYYFMRLITLYLGAVLSPLVLVLALMPGWRQFSWLAIKSYLVTVFILFVHNLILLVAANLFLLALAVNDFRAQSLMLLLIGLATLICLLKTPKLLAEMNYASLTPKTLTKLGRQAVAASQQTAYQIKTAHRVARSGGGF